VLESVKGFHLEPTNICTLKCPRCPRTEFLDTFGIKRWSNQNLNLDHLENFLDIDLTGKRFTLNGNYGDPIYYNGLFDLVKFIKNKKANITIHTNGSYKTQDWWQELAKLVDHNDIITFSIDGTPENFTNYRVNADWESIKIGIDTMVRSPIRVTWKYIVFSFNENTVDQARLLAHDYGVDDFTVVNSDRWRTDDWLKPNNYAIIETDKKVLFNSAHVGGRHDSIDLWKSGNRNLEIDPLCKNTGSHFISANGYYMPCCWMGDYRFYYQTMFYKNKEKFDISKTTITSLLTNSEMVDFYNNLENNKLKVCTFNCGKND
jgi:MoaA/NifB/PqqE/SkfB family radical SAM enzyme